MVRQRVRIRFRKEGDLRLTSHRDLLRAWERLFRRARLPLGMSEGFHPRPRMQFASALALGVAGADEVLDVELSRPLAADQIGQAVAPHLPPGLVVNSVEVLPAGARKAQVRSITLQIPVPPERREGAAQRIAALQAAGAHLIEREGRDQPIDVCEHLMELALAGEVLRIRLRVTHSAAARPRDVLAAVGLDDLLEAGHFLTRTAVELDGPDESPSESTNGEQPP